MHAARLFLPKIFHFIMLDAILNIIYTFFVAVFVAVITSFDSKWCNKLPPGQVDVSSFKREKENSHKHSKHRGLMIFSPCANHDDNDLVSWVSIGNIRAFREVQFRLFAHKRRRFQVHFKTHITEKWMVIRVKLMHFKLNLWTPLSFDEHIKMGIVSELDTKYTCMIFTSTPRERLNDKTRFISSRKKCVNIIDHLSLLSRDIRIHLQHYSHTLFDYNERHRHRRFGDVRTMTLSLLFQ